MNIEYIKLIASLLTPVVILILGIWAKSIASNHQQRISLNDRIIEKRVAIYEAVGQDLNDIYAFLTQVGHWKNFTPDEIIQKKRDVDKIMYVNRPYWSNSAFEKYGAFMAAGFATWTGVGEDAKIRTYTDQFKKLQKWNDTWESYFSNKDIDIRAIRSTYSQLMSAFSEQFGFIQE